MRNHRLSIIFNLAAYTFFAFQACVLAEPPSSVKSQTTEERLAAIEGKLLQLENRLNQALGTGAPKLGATGIAAEAGSATPIPVQLAALDQKLRIVARNKELDAEAAANKLRETPVVSAGKEGFWIKSADNNFRLRVGGYLQADSRFFTGDDPDRITRPSTFVMRRIRPILQGTVYKYFDFKIMPEFGNNQTEIADAYGEVTYFPVAKVRFGKFKPPIGLERLASSSELLFVERGLPSDLVPNRDVGVQVAGESLARVFTYQLGIFNGVPDGTQGNLDTNNQKDFVGRIFLTPFGRTTVEPLKGLGVGLSSSVGSQLLPLPVYRSEGQSIFFNYVLDATPSGNRQRLSPQAYYYWKSLGLLGEFVQSAQNVRLGTTTSDINNQSWQVAGSYVLTGEKASYQSVTPAKMFNPRQRQFGAFELAARYSQLKIDNDAFILKFADIKNSAKAASAWTVGLNWYFDKNVKFQVNYEQTHFTGGSEVGNRATEKVIMSCFQVYF